MVLPKQSSQQALRKMVQIVLHTDCGDIPHVLQKQLISNIDSSCIHSGNDQVITKAVYFSDIYPFYSSMISTNCVSKRFFHEAGFDLKPVGDGVSSKAALFFGVQNPLKPRAKHESYSPSAASSEILFTTVGGKRSSAISDYFKAAVLTQQSNIVVQAPAFYDESLYAETVGAKKHLKCAKASTSVLEAFLAHNAACETRLSLYATIPLAAYLFIDQWTELISLIKSKCEAGDIRGLIIEQQPAMATKLADASVLEAVAYFCALIPNSNYFLLGSPSSAQTLLMLMQHGPRIGLHFIDTSIASMYAERGLLICPRDEFPSVEVDGVPKSAAIDLNYNENKSRRAYLLDQLVSPSTYGKFQCSCYTCKNYTVSYLSHLFGSSELLGETLASIHNLNVMYDLANSLAVADDQQALANGTQI